MTFPTKLTTLLAFGLRHFPFSFVSNDGQLMLISSQDWLLPISLLHTWAPPLFWIICINIHMSCCFLKFLVVVKYT